MAQPVFPAAIAYDHNKGSYVEEYTPGTAGNAFIVGSFVKSTSGAEPVILCGADPALILGISEVVSADAALLTPNGKVPVRVLNAEAVLAMSSTTVPVAATHLGQKYGIVNNSGVWQVDTTDAVNTRVEVVRLDIDNGIWYVKVLAANLENAGIVS